MIKQITAKESECLVCDCGNNMYSSGFVPCDCKGKEMEPSNKNWEGLYKCLRCGRIYKIKKELL